MKILIVSYHFYPNNAPRAFRTHELVKEFCMRGFEVDLVLPYKKEYATQADPQLEGKGNFRLELLGKDDSFEKPSISKFLHKENLIRKVAKRVYRYFNPFTETKSYISLVDKHLSRTTKKYDMIISIAHPFSTLFGTAKAIRKNPVLKNCPVKVAEYSDPFSLQKDVKMFFGYKLVDRWIANTFDYISIPTEKAIDSYKKIKEVNKIKVIPQGFNFDNIELKEYKKNIIPSFGYAGVFYEKLRNPQVLFDYLVNLKADFRFYIFTSPSNKDTSVIIEKYKDILKEKLIVSYNIPRLSLIKELSALDFLINVDNTSTNQVPSKLIDYALTKRPVYSFSQNNFDTAIFNKFFNEDYSHSTSVNIKEFDIKSVSEKFLSLI